MVSFSRSPRGTRSRKIGRYKFGSFFFDTNFCLQYRLITFEIRDRHQHCKSKPTHFHFTHPPVQNTPSWPRRPSNKRTRRLSSISKFFSQIFSEPFERSFNDRSLTTFLSLTTRKDAKKVHKLESQIPYHEGRGNNEEVEKIKAQIDAIWAKTREAVAI